MAREGRDSFRSPRTHCIKEDKVKSVKKPFDKKPLDKKKASDVLYRQAIKLAPQASDKFLEIAEVLYQLQDVNEYRILEFTEEVKWSSRKAYYLIDIGKALSAMPVNAARLQAIGPTKLKTIAPYITPTNHEDLLQKAEKHSVRDLQKLMKNQPLSEDERMLVLSFDGSDYDRVAKALIRFGAVRERNGIGGKEAAVLAMLDELGL